MGHWSFERRGPFFSAGRRPEISELDEIVARREADEKLADALRKFEGHELGTLLIERRMAEHLARTPAERRGRYASEGGSAEDPNGFVVGPCNIVRGGTRANSPHLLSGLPCPRPYPGNISIDGGTPPLRGVPPLTTGWMCALGSTGAMRGRSMGGPRLSSPPLASRFLNGAEEREAGHHTWSVWWPTSRDDGKTASWPGASPAGRLSGFDRGFSECVTQLRDNDISVDFQVSHCGRWSTWRGTSQRLSPTIEPGGCPSPSVWRQNRQ